MKINRSLLAIGTAGILVLTGAFSTFAQTTTATTTSPQAGPAAVGSSLETHIFSDGKVLIRGAKITSISGNTINATQNWGSYNLPWVVNITASTTIIRRFGAPASLSEFSVGDYISFTGMLDYTQSQATVNANTVRDFSIQTVNATFSGTVSSVNSSNTSFVLASRERGDVTVDASASTTIFEDNATTTFGTIAVGQTISRTSGIWNNLTNTLQANDVHIQTKSQSGGGLLNKRIFEGTLVSLAGTTAPTTFVFTVGNGSASNTYTVNVAANTALLSNSWNPIQLSQVQANSHVRIYGAIEASDTSMLDAYVVRDTSVK